MNEFEKYYNSEFFIIDSGNLDSISQKLYGFMLKEKKIIENDNFDFNEQNISLEGAYVLISVDDEQILIQQDFMGAYGLYLYQDDEYFAISNSLVKLIDYLKYFKNISLNNDFAGSFLFANLCTYSVTETLIDEITVIPRNYQILINKKTKSYKFIELDFKEQTIDIDSEEGINIIDKWYNKWVDIFRLIKSKTNNVYVELSGGFDSRIASVIWLTSNVDLNKIYIRSYGKGSKVKTFKEDFDIASKISDEFNFKLNNSYMQNSKRTYFEDINTILNISFYSKAGFSKLMKWKFGRYQERIFTLTGISGENIRGYPNKIQEDYVDKWSYVSKSYSAEFENPTRKILNSSFSSLRKNIYSEDSSKLTEKVYTETTTRHHHGKEIVEYYLENNIALAPSLDPELHKLKLTTNDCDDNLLLMAVIFQRFCSKLLRFDFEGGRKIPESTIKFAKLINEKYPLKKQNKKFINGPEINKNDLNERNTSFFNYSDMEHLLIKVFNSRTFKKEFLKYYSLKAYNKIKTEAKISKRFKHIYSAVIILKTIDDINGGKIFNNKIDNVDIYSWMENFIKLDLPEKKKSINYEPLSIYAKLRIDLANRGTKNNTVEILKSSDSNCDIDYPLWFITKFGRGVIVESCKGSIDLKFKCVNDGLLKLNFRGVDFKFQNKKIPIYINLTKVVCNNDILLNKNKLVWHENYYFFEKQVKDNEEIIIHAEWEPLI